MPGTVQKMKAGGIIKLILTSLKQMKYNIEKTYLNGVKVGNVPDHKVKLKRTDIGYNLKSNQYIKD